MMSPTVNAISLLELQRRITALVTHASTRDIWVTAELMDVAVRGGHCYMELVEKDQTGATTVAKCRGIIWANRYQAIASAFIAETGRQFATGLKVMVKVTANYHPVFGMSLVISDVDPAYTMGDLLRRRREILARLEAEGILDQNRSLEWPEVALRVAVVSAPGAAGYGDFINQLYANCRHLRFEVRLFPAVMQGERTPASVMSALESIVCDGREWDCVVIIRGGGATSDLAAFEDYDLAAAVAMFPLPIIVGIGHERDTTLLDYVANMRVKTPTAAAEWLIGHGTAALDRLRALAGNISAVARECVAGESTRLATCAGLLPVLPLAAVERRRSALKMLTGRLSSLENRTAAARTRLEALVSAIDNAAVSTVERCRARLDAFGQLLGALGPEATLKRGFSVTRIDGRAVTDASELVAGQTVTTILAHGSIRSVVTE